MILLERLIEKGILDKEKAASLVIKIKKSGQKEEEIILAENIISEKDLFVIKSDILKIPLKEVVSSNISLEALGLISEETAKYYKMVPLEKNADLLEVGMVYPEDLKAQEALKFISRQGKFNYQVFLITPVFFTNFLKQYRTLKKEVSRAIEELEVELKTEKTEVEPRTAAEFERLVEDAPITKVVAVLLRHAVEGKSSDIHIEPIKEKLRIRFRFLGVLYSSIFLPIRVHLAIIARIKILANLKIDESRIPQDGRFSAKINNQDIDFRVSTLPTTLGEKIVIRVLDPLAGVKQLEKIGLNERDLKIIKTAIKKPYGMILSTGPTGSGKTTTLYATLALLNKEGVNIVTLEDPVEYFVAGINQSQMRPEIGYNFASGLRHVLRQDPDIIMVGEIRDEETAALAIHAALTGHIVLSTLHTSNALGVIPRLIDLGIKPYLIPSALSVIIAQRLLRGLCNFCKKKIKPQKEIRDLILEEINNLSPMIKKTIKIPENFFIFEAKGCKKCGNTGFSSRIAVFEVLSMSSQLSDITLKEPSETKIIEEAKRQGMITMKQNGIIKVLDGNTTIEEVLRVSEEK